MTAEAACSVVMECVFLRTGRAQAGGPRPTLRAVSRTTPRSRRTARSIQSGARRSDNQAEYSPPLPPTGNPLATRSQPAARAGTGRSGGLTRSGLAVEHRRAERAGADVRTDRRPDHGGLDVCRSDRPDPGDDGGPKLVEVGADAVQDRQSLDRPRRHVVDRPLARLGPGPDLVEPVDRAIPDRDDRLDVEQGPDHGPGATDPAAPAEVLERVEADDRLDTLEY